MRRPFTGWDRAYLRRWYGRKTWRQLADSMGRCVGSVRCLGQRMGLGKKARCGMTESEAVSVRYRDQRRHLYRCEDCGNKTRDGYLCRRCTGEA